MKAYFDEAKAKQTLEAFRSGQVTINQVFPILQPIIKGIVNRKAFCEDPETKLDLVNEIWLGIIKYRLLEKYDHTRARAFSYLTGIANRTLYFVLGDRNKRTKTAQRVTLVPIDDALAVPTIDTTDQASLADTLSHHLADYPDLVAELIRSKCHDMPTFNEYCNAIGLDMVRVSHFIIRIKEARNAILEGCLNER